MALRYSDVPVVVAPAGLALGGGTEMALHADRVQAAAETYMGLVEVGVGLDSGWRRHQGDAACARWTRADAAERSAAVRAEGVRDDRARESVGERPRRAAAWIPRRDRRRSR